MLSTKRAWKAVEDKFNAGETVEGEVIEVVKGGLILDIWPPWLPACIPC